MKHCIKSVINNSSESSKAQVNYNLYYRLKEFDGLIQVPKNNLKFPNYNLKSISSMFSYDLLMEMVKSEKISTKNEITPTRSLLQYHLN